ncbi:hypothetical protein LCGC14_1712590 [marine sediment metagenome]|uniref:Uncharacterized protein n=1 Tax=marine sediment metagenome TaxID=412755 RepID=A0A0F9I263_9ZZZZ
MFACLFLLNFMRRSTTFLYPCLQAVNNGVPPVLLVISSAALCTNNNSTRTLFPVYSWLIENEISMNVSLNEIGNWDLPDLEAIHNAVELSFAAASTFAEFASKILTT